VSDRPAPIRAVRVSDGSAFERSAGYCRAVRHGNHVSVSGTAALGPDGVLFPGDSYRQTVEALRRALAAAADLGAQRADVLRSRLLLAPGCDWQAATRAHGEAFADEPPANTTYYVAGFVPEGVLVEIELDALASQSTAEPYLSNYAPAVGSDPQDGSLR
jgi:enamine deaminase RidA (YjgF/YER057c/UK114 family)